MKRINNDTVHVVVQFDDGMKVQSMTVFSNPDSAFVHQRKLNEQRPAWPMPAVYVRPVYDDSREVGK